MMRSGVLTVVFALGCSVLGCGGSQGRAVNPDASSDEALSETTDEGWDDEDASESVGSSDDETGGNEGFGTSPSGSERRGAPPATKEADEEGAGQCRESSAGLSLSVDRKFVSLEQGTLQAQMDGRICNIALTITRKDGLPSLTKRFGFTGSKRELRWTPIPRDQITKIEVRIESDDGGYESVFLVPWSVSIDHEEVEFDTNQAIIRGSEVASLEESLRRIKEVLAEVEGEQLGTITLFIAGHTDTRGSDHHNMTLSRNRARAIANWFVQGGLCIPIAFEGFGEAALKKLTEDEVDEIENRRVDYVLSVEPPMIRKGAAPAWSWLSKGC